MRVAEDVVLGGLDYPVVDRLHLGLADARAGRPLVLGQRRLQDAGDIDGLRREGTGRA